MDRYDTFPAITFGRGIAGVLEKCMKSLEGLSAHDQLVEREIYLIKLIDPEEMGASATIAPTERGFHIRLRKDRREFWSVDVGHELAHTFYFDIDTPYGGPARVLPRTVTGEEEEFCDWFGFRWAAMGNNDKEIMAFIDSTPGDIKLVSRET